MPVNLSSPSDLLPVAGVRAGAGRGGIKHPDRLDVAVFELAEGARAAAVFTRNAFRAAPVAVAQRHLTAAAPRALIINSGNANAGTGAAGLRDAEQVCARLAERIGCAPEAVVPFSTGVIGESLPVERVAEGARQAVDDLRDDGWLDAARAIMTTDTVPKAVSRHVELSQGTATLTGIAKGSGMIRPDMATMLAYIATDASIEPAMLDAALRDAVNGSFNRITVDGDTSTNDAVMLAATGRGPGVEDGSADAERWRDALVEVCRELAVAIVRDGEGATKLMTIMVDGGMDESECRRVADAVAHSPLVKTAFYACDPNWGRILAAVGRAGVEGLDIDAVRIDLDEVRVVRDGGRDPGYTEDRGQAVMDRDEITLRIGLGRGEASTTVWTCDLSHEYVTINAEYRT